MHKTVIVLSLRLYLMTYLTEHFFEQKRVYARNSNTNSIIIMSLPYDLPDWTFLWTAFHHTPASPWPFVEKVLGDWLRHSSCWQSRLSEMSPTAFCTQHSSKLCAIVKVTYTTLKVLKILKILLQSFFSHIIQWQLWWQTTLKEIPLMRNHPDEGPPWWWITLRRDHPDEGPPWWDQPIEGLPWWDTTLRKDHPEERPPWGETTLFRDYPHEGQPWGETTMMRDHPFEGWPWGETTLRRDHWRETTLMRNDPDERLVTE